MKRIGNRNEIVTKLQQIVTKLLRIVTKSMQWKIPRDHDEHGKAVTKQQRRQKQVGGAGTAYEIRNVACISKALLKAPLICQKK